MPMPIPTAARESVVILPGMSVLEIQGAESTGFLQSQLSSDLTELQPGGCQWTAWLNPKGRVVAVGLLLARSPDLLWWLLPDHPADSLAASLGRYVLRRKASLAARTDLSVAAAIGPSEPPAGAEAGIGLDGAEDRRLWVVPVSDLPLADLDFADRWRSLDIACGVPRLDAEGGSHTAHMLGLDRLGALSLGKGCYPGQEIVARTHYLGQSKRSIAQLALDPDCPLPVAGTSVLRAGAAVGEVLCAVASADRIHVQAVLAVDALEELEIDSRPARRLELAAAPRPRPLD